MQRLPELFTIWLKGVVRANIGGFLIRAGLKKLQNKICKTVRLKELSRFHPDPGRAACAKIFAATFLQPPKIFAIVAPAAFLDVRRCHCHQAVDKEGGGVKIFKAEQAIDST